LVERSRAKFRSSMLIKKTTSTSTPSRSCFFFTHLIRRWYVEVGRILYDLCSRDVSYHRLPFPRVSVPRKVRKILFTRIQPRPHKIFPPCCRTPPGVDFAFLPTYLMVRPEWKSVCTRPILWPSLRSVRTGMTVMEKFFSRSGRRNASLAFWVRP